MWQKIKCFFGHHKWIEIDRGLQSSLYSSNLFYIKEKCFVCGERRIRFVNMERERDEI